jgi:hypothetical protein
VAQFDGEPNILHSTASAGTLIAADSSRASSADAFTSETFMRNSQFQVRSLIAAWIHPAYRPRYSAVVDLTAVSEMPGRIGQSW